MIIFKASCYGEWSLPVFVIFLFFVIRLQLFTQNEIQLLFLEFSVVKSNDDSNTKKKSSTVRPVWVFDVAIFFCSPSPIQLLNDVINCVAK